MIIAWQLVNPMMVLWVILDGTNRENHHQIKSGEVILSTPLDHLQVLVGAIGFEPTTP
jgi:hypothetical protein